MQEVRYWYNTPARRNAQDARNKMEAARSAAALRTAWDKRRQLPLTVICGDGNIGVKGSGFELLFSIPEQGPVSLRKGRQGVALACPDSGVLACQHR